VGGKEILIHFLKTIIDDDDLNNRNTMMRHVEDIQTRYGSRKSEVEHPLLFLVYLPVNSGNNIIDTLQRTLVKFLKENALWKNYQLEYSNSRSNSGSTKQICKNFQHEIRERTIKAKKKGSILFLGNQGGVGITYDDCDVTISLDDGHSLDNDRQKKARCMTPSVGKTVGINVDMNVQRTYTSFFHIIQQIRQSINKRYSIAHICYYLYEQKIFMFNPQEYPKGFGTIVTAELKNHFKNMSSDICNYINDTDLLNSIQTTDDLRDYIQNPFTKCNSVITIPIPEGCEGEQPLLPKGEKHIVQYDKKPNGDEIDERINKTLELCRTFLFPLLALMSLAYNIDRFIDLFVVKHTKSLLYKILIDNEIDINKHTERYVIIAMNSILDQNHEIIDQIREIYRTASPSNLKRLVERHFVPSRENKQNHGEISTPNVLVEKMLDELPLNFWKRPRRVFEPCCGKGNFVLAIFDRFYEGLQEYEPNDYKRAILIMNKCIYFADLIALNVFITTELLRCHMQHRCKRKCRDNLCSIQFNSFVGDTISATTMYKWSINKFDAIIGNPPYSTNPSKPDARPLYNIFTQTFIDRTRILLFVIPSRWFMGGKGLNDFRKMMISRKDIKLIIHIDDATEWFGKNIQIKGGVHYFLKDESYVGTCNFNGVQHDLSKYDDIIIKPEFHRFVDTILNKQSTMLSDIYVSSGFFKYRTNDSRLKDQGNVKCFVSSLKAKNRCKYIDSFIFTDKNSFWKVVTSRAAHKAFSGFGEMFIAKPDEIYTDSYISFKVETENEAKALQSYLKTRFANYMLSIRKISQDINRNTCKWVPLVPLDRIWDDDKVCKFLSIEKTLYIE
jgi:site-specific DNA-methyltransferase (adenine-specific)